MAARFRISLCFSNNQLCYRT